LPDPAGDQGCRPVDLEKITTRCGPQVVRQLNETLLAKADAAKLVRTGKVRADTTVIPANVAYPTDSGLLAKAIRRITALTALVHAAGAASRTRVHDRRGAAQARAHAIACHLRKRTEEAKGKVLVVTGKLAAWLRGLACGRRLART
jgi:IS5 family transposase